MHDGYYGVLTDPVALATELEKYIKHTMDCMNEDGILPEVKQDLEMQIYYATKVRENIRRIFDE